MKASVFHITNDITQDQVEAGRLQEVYDISVESGKNITLPSAFETDVRTDVVRKAVRVSRANRRQAYGSKQQKGKKRPMPGMRHSVEWWGKGRGVSRILRKTGAKTGAENPHTRGGRRAHGPKVEKDWSMAINTTERRLARDSALAATTDKEIVSTRGHRFHDEIDTLPLIIGDYKEVRDEGEESMDIEAFSLEHPTRKLIAILESLGLGDDLQRARDGRKVRAGKGTMRGRRHRTPKSVLMVVSQKSGLAMAGRNIPGVDVVSVRDLAAEDLAPGGDVGRLTVFTKKAVEELA
ncbi:MAG: 50S ribosomal protein L4 [Euryarchaeota archaeon]|jgi:large subunit ribosomal protein L4e|nr:50S ribosomal protein L4 [Euryarchaeota archaeon]MBT7937985.1 50S ribosomal protein L4 [Euryarchaeota archaeon]